MIFRVGLNIGVGVVIIGLSIGVEIIVIKLNLEKISGLIAET